MSAPDHVLRAYYEARPTSSIEGVAAHFGVGRTTAYKALKRAGTRFHERREWSTACLNKGNAIWTPESRCIPPLFCPTLRRLGLADEMAEFIGCQSAIEDCQDDSAWYSPWGRDGRVGGRGVSA